MSKTNDNGCVLNVIDTYFNMFWCVLQHVTLVALFPSSILYSFAFEPMLEKKLDE